MEAIERKGLWFELLNVIKRVDYNDMAVICDGDDDITDANAADEALEWNSLS